MGTRAAARRTAPRAAQDAFRHKLALNAFMIRQFGTDPLHEHRDADGRLIPPVRVLSVPLRASREGLESDGLHRFFHALRAALPDDAPVTRADLVRYEENLVRHTEAINTGRERRVEWKYFQWLTLLFVERYLDLYFNHSLDLLEKLNRFVEDFNGWREEKGLRTAVQPFTAEELNKVCLQNATGSGKTLLMHVNLLQFRHYARDAGRLGLYSRAILLTPGEDLTEQHLRALTLSGIPNTRFRPDLLSQPGHDLNRVDALEVHKLGDEDKEKVVATRSFGDANLLLVDEGHVGLGNRESETGFLARRNALAGRGFVFEYSATFAQAVEAADDEMVTQAYAKSVLFDYSYRYFYEDGFGKDYQIYNFADGEDFASRRYLTACLLSFFQQLLLFEEHRHEFRPFNLEKPLWVFVGAYVTKAGGANQEERASLSDVAKIIRFLGEFLADPERSRADIEVILSGHAEQSGLVDENGNAIFERSFLVLKERLGATGVHGLHEDVLRRLFQNPAGGRLTLKRIRGNENEIALKAGTTETPFGVINVGAAADLTRYLREHPELVGLVNVLESDFDDEALFGALGRSASPVNVLVGSRRFVAGWDSWRVSTLGLMRVGTNEGAQIIQLFGRGVRLQGYQWSLKRSRHTGAPEHPRHIELLETLGVFGVRSDYMQKFREYLASEGLPGNERTRTFEIPMSRTYDFHARLKVLRPKRKRDGGQEYDFRRDGARLTLGPPPEHLRPVEVDWYPRIQSVVSRGGEAVADRHTARLAPVHLAFVDWDAVRRALEEFRRVRGFHTLGIAADRLPGLFETGADGWYTLLIPEHEMEASGWRNVEVWQRVATELLKRYAEAFYNYHQRAFIEPRLELRDLAPDDGNLPRDGEAYQVIVNADADALIQDVERLQREVRANRGGTIRAGAMKAFHLGAHLYTPLLSAARGTSVRIAPVSLNDSEADFVENLEAFLESPTGLDLSATDVYLLRNRSRGSGIGFFEAGGFHPDFILWAVRDGVQHIGFVEPHGLVHENPGSPKIRFAREIKGIEARLGAGSLTLDSFVLSPTPHGQLRGWGWGGVDQFAARHVLFLADPDHVRRLLSSLLASTPVGTKAGGTA